MIDPHVHLRDWSQAEQETLEHGFSVAWRAGISAVFEMPNTDPPLTGRAAVLRRISDADAARERLGIPLFHGIYAGITADPAQLAEIVALHRELFPRVMGFKLFAGHSTGNMGVVTRDEQARVWDTLARLDYRGVVTVHAETEALLAPWKWDPTAPISHGAARPVDAEIHSVNQQIELAAEAGFRGSVHLAHITTPAVLDIVERNRRAFPFAIRGGVTAHHALLDENVARRSEIPEWKVNPPLRPPEVREALWQRVRTGRIDWIESDHAPHTWQDKRAAASGVPGLPAFRLLRDLLTEELSREDVERITHDAVVTAFDVPRGVVPENPAAGDIAIEQSPHRFREAAWRRYRSLAQEYPWDPFRFLDG